jgi:hypothetical protein
MIQNTSDYWANLRSELNDWKLNMKVTDQEIADGFKISRPVVNQFMRWNGSETEKKGTKQTLAIYRQDLIALWEYITSEERINAIKSETAKDNRRKLRSETANNILEKSGFLGIDRQSVIEDDPSKLEKLHRIIFRLSNKSLTSRDLWKMEEMVINHLAEMPSKNIEKDPIIGIDKAKKMLGEKYDNIDIYWREVESTLKRYQDLGRKSFQESELIELFQNIAENQKLRKTGFQSIRVIACEIKNIDLVYKRLNDNYKTKNVLENILTEGIFIERKLRGIEENKSSFNFFMNEVKLTCKLDKDKEIVWFYRSCSSTLDNIISAIKQGIGHDLELKGLSSYVLAEGSDSIVRVSAILKNSQDYYYTGRWVDMDTILSFAQAIIIAAENWISDKITSRNEYNHACEKFTEIINQIDVSIRKPHEYGIYYHQITNNDDIETSQTQTDTIKEFEKYVGIIEENLTNIPEKSGAYAHYIKFLKRNKYQALLAQSRAYHIVGDIENANLIIKKIARSKKEELEEYPFDSTDILWKVEEMMHKFYTSEENFIPDRLWLKELEQIERKIERYLKDKGVNFLTDSLYNAFAELYGNIGRFDFYNCSLERFNIKRLETALIFSQRAAYFAMKIDDAKRVSHWLARCSRILCRLSRDRDASQYLSASESVLQRSVTPQPQYQQRSKGLMVEINIANGEQCLLKETYKDSIKYFVDALLGAINLRFARIMAGSLYGIYRASKEGKLDIYAVLNNDKIITEDTKATIEEIYKQLSEDEKNREEKSLDLFYESIKILHEVLNAKISIQEAPSRFKNQAIKTWNSWAAQSQNNNTQHLIAAQMEADTFLGIITK